MNKPNLKKTLDALYAEYHNPSYLRYDPLEYVRGMRGKENREIAGLICSVLAYGRVEQIRKTLQRIFEITGTDLVRFCTTVPLSKKITRLCHVKHRFNDGRDMAMMLECAGLVIMRQASLEALFCAGYKDSDTTIKHSLEKFVLSFRRMACDAGEKPSSSFEFLLPQPSRGSTCKRLNMFLRWMVRKDDGIDLGEWTRVPASKLVMPVDTHVAALARSMGITSRKSVDWAMAEDITRVMRDLYPDDPVRCDFSLCRTGMIDFRNVTKAA